MTRMFFEERFSSDMFDFDFDDDDVNDEEDPNRA